MKHKLCIMMLTGIMLTSMLMACGKTQPKSSKTIKTASNVSSTASSKVASKVSKAVDQTSVTHPSELNFVISQDVRDHMFKLINADDKTLTVDTDSKQGYTGDLVPKLGEYDEAKKSVKYVLPYSEKFTLYDMDDKPIHVRLEYPYVTSICVQNAAVVTMDENRTVTITGYNKDEFSYYVWLPSKGATKEVVTELATGKTSGVIKIYYKEAKIVIEQLSYEGLSAKKGTSLSPTDLFESEQGTDEDSNATTVNWQVACPFADKIAKGTWDDGADLSNVKQLRKGIMSAKFTPVTEVKEKDVKVIKLTFYDENNEKLGVMNFWQKGKHVQFDDKLFDYDDLGLEN